MIYGKHVSDDACLWDLDVTIFVIFYPNQSHKTHFFYGLHFGSHMTHISLQGSNVDFPDFLVYLIGMVLLVWFISKILYIVYFVLCSFVFAL